MDRLTHRPASLAQGESIQISRRGVPVTRLAPVEAAHALDRRRLADEIRQLRKGITLGGLSVRQLVQEGRRS